MRVFMTGASGFLGSHVAPKLIQAGHHVVGLTRSATGAARLDRAGVDVMRGDVNDLELIRAQAAAADGVIHLAFDHDPTDERRHSEADRVVVEALGDAVAGSDRPLIVTSGTALARSRPGELATEADGHAGSAEFARAATEEAADLVIARGGHAIVVRLPQVHDAHTQGRITWMIRAYRQLGRVLVVDDGSNRVPAVHVSDAVTLYRLALERGRGGSRYHAVAEEGVPLRDIGEVVAHGLRLPLEEVTAAVARDRLGRLGDLLALDLAASSAVTRRELPWEPIGPSLLSDLGAMDYDAV